MVSRAHRPSAVVVTALLFAAAVYFLLPVAWVVIAATKSTSDLFGTFGLWFSHPRLGANLSRLTHAEGGLYWRWTLNSFGYAGIGALAATLLSAAAGYAMAKYRFRGRETMFSLVLAGVLVPPTVVALPMYLMFSKIGLTGTYWSVLLPGMVSPFGVYLARVYAHAAVPDELLEAARIDGAGEYRIFFRVALKVMSPALVTIFLFQFIGIWNNYFLPLVMLSDQRRYPVTLGLTQWNSQTFRDPAFFELTVTGAAVSALLLGLTIASLQRFWRAGLTAGSVKG